MPSSAAAPGQDHPDLPIRDTQRIRDSTQNATTEHSRQRDLGVAQNGTTALEECAADWHEFGVDVGDPTGQSVGMNQEELSDAPSFSADFYRTLPAKQVGAGCIFLDESSRVLLVKPTYKPGWELPGGVVEQDESPLDACRREVAEELGLDRAPERLLGVDYRRAVDGVRGDALRFVFLGGVLTVADTSAIRLDSRELSEWRFVALDDLDSMVTPVMARRVRAFVDRSAVGYLEEGFLPGPP